MKYKLQHARLPDLNKKVDEYEHTFEFKSS